MIGPFVLCVALLGAAGTDGMAAAPPAWVQEAAATKTGRTGAAVVLLDQMDITITADARVRSSRRYAVRLNDRAGRNAAALREVYLTGSGKVRGVRAWIIRASGESRELGDREVVDVAFDNNDVYNEVRVRAISATDQVGAGDVFAAEAEREDRLLFSQFEWPLQDRWHVERARRSLTLPEGWRASAVTFNAGPMEPRRAGNTLVWEARALPEPADEPGRPPITDLVPRLAVSIFAREGTIAPGQFEGWPDVARWLHALSDASAQSSEDVTTKARELTEGLTSDFDRVAAIGRFAQRVQYVSIQTGVGRGGGYQPRPASLVLQRNYGDCKDKASLMRAMLAALGIKSYLVSIYSGDRNYVRSEWPSPQQFNHAIIAVSLADESPQATSVIDHPRFGRLLLFDPTDEHTPAGELPLHEQGSLALIVAPDGGDLVRIPTAPVDHHRIDRTVDGKLDAAGALSVKIREERSGTFAVGERARVASLDPDGYRSSVVRRVAPVIPRARINDVTAQAHPTSPDVFVVSVELSATDFSQSQGPLVLVTPPFDPAARVELPGTKARHTPIDLGPRRVAETVRLAFPETFAVDELPSNVTLETPFGTYSINYAVEGGQLVASRSLEVPLQTIRPEEYSRARDFFDKVRAADTAPVVFVRR